MNSKQYQVTIKKENGETEVRYFLKKDAAEGFAFVASGGLFDLADGKVKAEIKEVPASN